MNPNPLEQTFGGTTVNLPAVKAYLSSDPGYLELAIEFQATKHERYVANYADYFEFNLRRYVANQSKTLHRVFIEVRAFLTFNEAEARLLIPLLVNQVGQTLLLNEWYELIPRHERAKERIENRFGL